METKFELKQKVVIKGNGLTGIVTSIWFRISGDPLYEVRYCDKNGLIAERYFEADALDAVSG